jgi:hypothetical protein
MRHTSEYDVINLVKTNDIIVFYHHGYNSHMDAE